MIEELFFRLKAVLERNSTGLKQGEAFLPEYLKENVLTKDIFPPIASALASDLDLELRPEMPNPMPPGYECGTRQIVDYAFYKGESVHVFMELESLDRAQIYLFREHKEIEEKNIDNKLWYYCGTLGQYYTFRQQVPRFFVFFLVLPDQKVSPYTLWDVGEAYRYEFFHPSLSELVYQNPYRFYDHLIKTSARLFLEKEQEFKDPQTNNWHEEKPVDFQDVCELVFITCTIKELVLSRGKDLFDFERETRARLQWA